MFALPAGRLLNKRPDSEELAVFETLLKSICHIIPVVSREKRSKYKYLNDSFGERKEGAGAGSRGLIEDDGLFADIEAMLATIGPASAPADTDTGTHTHTGTGTDSHSEDSPAESGGSGSSGSSGSGLQSFDELRLAEEIHMEDQIYSDEQIKRALSSKRGSRNDIVLGTESDGGEELDAMFGRLQFIKTDMFSDFCNKR
jgi:hypothetical protein